MITFLKPAQHDLCPIDDPVRSEDNWGSQDDMLVLLLRREVNKSVMSWIHQEGRVGRESSLSLGFGFGTHARKVGLYTIAIASVLVSRWSRALLQTLQHTQRVSCAALSLLVFDQSTQRNPQATRTDYTDSTANMQRIEPRAEAAPSGQEGQQGQQGQQQTGRPGQWSLPTGFASTGRESHTQSFEEIYGVPENFLEIEVRAMYTWIWLSTWISMYERRLTSNPQTGYRSANTPADCLAIIAIHDISHPTRDQHSCFQATTKRSPSTIFRL